MKILLAPLTLTIALTTHTSAAQQNLKFDYKTAPSLIVFEREAGHFELTDGSRVVGYKLRLPVDAGPGDVWFQPCLGTMTRVPSSALKDTQKSCSSEPTVPPTPLWGFTISSEVPAGMGAPAPNTSKKLTYWAGQTGKNPMTLPGGGPKTVDCAELAPALKAAFSSSKPLQKGTLVEQTGEGGALAKTNFMEANAAKVVEQYQPAELNGCPSPVTLQAFPVANPTQFGLQADTNLYAVFLKN